MKGSRGILIVPLLIFSLLLGFAIIHSAKTEVYDVPKLSIEMELSKYLYNDETSYIMDRNKRAAFLTWYSEEQYANTLENYKDCLKEVEVKGTVAIYIEGEDGNFLLYSLPDKNAALVLADNSEENLKDVLAHIKISNML